MDFELGTQFALCNNREPHPSVICSVSLSLQEHLYLAILGLWCNAMWLTCYYCEAAFLVVDDSDHWMYWVSACRHILIIYSSDVKAFDKFESVGVCVEPGLVDGLTPPYGSQLKSIGFILNLQILKQNFSRNASICIDLKLYKTSPLFEQVCDFKRSYYLVSRVSFGYREGLECTQGERFLLCGREGVVAWWVLLKLIRFLIKLTCSVGLVVAQTETKLILNVLILHYQVDWVGIFQGQS